MLLGRQTTTATTPITTPQPLTRDELAELAGLANVLAAACILAEKRLTSGRAQPIEYWSGRRANRADSQHMSASWLAPLSFSAARSPLNQPWQPAKSINLARLIDASELLLILLNPDSALSCCFCCSSLLYSCLGYPRLLGCSASSHHWRFLMAN